MKKNLLLLTAVLAISLLMAGIMFAVALDDGRSPIAENLEISTFRGVSVGGVLKAFDLKGESLCFEITTPPTKGEIQLEENGCFVYTPREGKMGKDYFGYKAIDESGNKSGEATVIIKLLKQKTETTYSDMERNPAEYAALVLAEKDIYIGECIGGKFVFHPNESVSRGDFLSMCMKMLDKAPISGVLTTGFADDNEIPEYMKSYVSTGLLTGIVGGYSNGFGVAVFACDKSISYAEAAVMLNRALSLTDVKYLPQEVTPAWAAQAVCNLNACRISDSVTTTAEMPLTRAECAKLLSGAAALIENR